MKRCKCGTLISSEGVARGNLTCARCARLKRERNRSARSRKDV